MRKALERREIRQHREQATGHDDGLAADTVGKCTEHDEEWRTDDKRSREELLAEVNQLRMELAYLKKLEALVQARPKQAPKKKRK